MTHLSDTGATGVGRRLLKLSSAHDGDPTVFDITVAFLVAAPATTADHLDPRIF